MDQPTSPSRGPAWKWLVCGWLLLATMILYMDRLVLTQQEYKIRVSFGMLPRVTVGNPYFESAAYQSTKNYVDSHPEVDESQILLGSNGFQANRAFFGLRSKKEDEPAASAAGIQAARHFFAKTDTSNTKYALLDSAFSVAFAFGALLAGWLADRWSVYLLYPLAVTLWSMMGGITGVIEGYGLLITCRFFLGFFEAGHWPCALKTTQRILPPAQRTLGNGILQSGAAIGSVVTPLVLLLIGAFTTSWRPSFLIVGGLGLAWVLGWFYMVKRHEVDQPTDKTPVNQPVASGSWLEVFRQKRYWIAVAVVICINSTWHFFRVWMPVILREIHGFQPDQVQLFSVAYYVAADIGSLATGIFSIMLVRHGFSVHASRLWVFGVCAGLAMLSLTAIIAPGQPVFLWVLPVVAFASLGLFPPYYSLTQELTVKNQGKVTGSLGFICWMVMAGLRAMEGIVADQVKSRGGDVADQYSFGIILAGVMPMAALLALVFFWRDEPSRARSGAQ